MPRIALLHALEEFSSNLADGVDAIGAPYEVDVFRQDTSRPKRVRRALIGEYDLLQADETLANGLLASGAGFLRFIPTVICFRGWADYTNAHGQYGRLRSAAIAARTRLALRRASGVAYLSDATRTQIQERYAAPEGRIVGRPFDVSTYASGSPPAAYRDDGPFRILTVTNLRYRRKLEGVLLTLEALEPVFEANPGTEYLVAGGGRHLPDLEERMERYPYAEKVEVLGHRTDVPDLLAAANLFVYVSELDAHPMAVLEAQAAGLPVVTNDMGGVPAAAGTAGVVCETTAGSIREAVLSLREDPNRLAALARASRTRMETYNEEVAAQVVDLWDAVLERST
jgi:glycosyltransferase involved in cell wall biosynthesis